ncbi:XtmB Phage terminase large subunit [uncultured Caudovirales phage]|uniref:XtmB Phage terminase large subunit n=1 Tax=uncultured Caudovirales phage TaxID=2100421 RepID=A0A6J7X0C5_9CAUD|nr:XtmB Phage terminase large subunit [uncultured Caudovirales phage]
MIKLNPKYKPLIENDTRYFVVTGGRGSGKSFEVGAFVSALSFESGHKILFTRQTMTSAHLSIIPEFQEKIDLLEANHIFDINKAEIKNKRSNSEIIFKGIKTSSGDQTANLKSLQGVTTWILDEAEELINEDIFDKINLSIRQKGIQNRIILILNPATKEHWIYKRFFESEGVEAGFNGIKGNTTYIHTTYQDNLDNLDESFINEINKIKDTNPKKYEHVILGGWLNKAEGVVFTNWRFGDFNPNQLQTSFGMDFGFSIDPDALAEVAIDKDNKRIYVKEHIYDRGLKTHILAEIIKDRAGSKLIIADSAEPRLIDDLKHLGINIIPVKKGTIESGIVRMQDYEIIVEENSSNIAKEFNNYCYLNKASKLYIDNWNHIIDAIRYNVIYNLDNPNKGKYFIY